ncbi:MAG TPA: hypothetical protein VN643_03630 [Pyrinomonadaceae bacterium]|nr:hypothetical protein [Pyrinomonadaceae bacterium]
MSGQQRKIQRKSRTRKTKTEEPQIQPRPAPTIQVATHELDRFDEQMAEILGERQTHQVISDARLYEDNRQKGGE